MPKNNFRVIVKRNLITIYRDPICKPDIKGDRYNTDEYWYSVKTLKTPLQNTVKCKYDEFLLLPHGEKAVCKKTLETHVDIDKFNFIDLIKQKNMVITKSQLFKELRDNKNILSSMEKSQIESKKQVKIKVDKKFPRIFDVRHVYMQPQTTLQLLQTPSVISPQQDYNTDQIQQLMIERDEKNKTIDKLNEKLSKIEKQQTKEQLAMIDQVIKKTVEITEKREETEKEKFLKQLFNSLPMLDIKGIRKQLKDYNDKIDENIKLNPQRRDELTANKVDERLEYEGQRMKDDLMVRICKEIDCKCDDMNKIRKGIGYTADKDYKDCKK